MAVRDWQRKKNERLVWKSDTSLWQRKLHDEKNIKSKNVENKLYDWKRWTLVMGIKNDDDDVISFAFRYISSKFVYSSKRNHFSLSIFLAEKTIFKLNKCCWCSEMQMFVCMLIFFLVLFIEICVCSTFTNKYTHTLTKKCMCDRYSRNWIVKSNVWRNRNLSKNNKKMNEKSSIKSFHFTENQLNWCDRLENDVCHFFPSRWDSVRKNVTENELLWKLMN